MTGSDNSRKYIGISWPRSHAQHPDSGEIGRARAALRFSQRCDFFAIFSSGCGRRDGHCQSGPSWADSSDATAWRQKGILRPRRRSPAEQCRHRTHRIVATATVANAGQPSDERISAEHHESGHKWIDDGEHENAADAIRDGQCSPVWSVERQRYPLPLLRAQRVSGRPTPGEFCAAEFRQFSVGLNRRGGPLRRPPPARKRIAGVRPVLDLARSEGFFGVETTATALASISARCWIDRSWAVRLSRIDSCLRDLCRE